jgi:hypothetical protein
MAGLSAIGGAAEELRIYVPAITVTMVAALRVDSDYAGTSCHDRDWARDYTSMSTQTVFSR